MVNYQAVIDAIPSPNWRDKDIIDVQDTNDIIKDLIYCFKRYNDQAAPIAKKFSTGNIKSDAKNIYNFIKDNIEYIAEPEKYQTTRSFSRIIFDKNGDCKHSALLASSIAWNLGYNVIFRFVSYDKGKSFGHVYTLIQDPKTKQTVVIDPLQSFNTEKIFYSKQDYKANNNLKFHPMLSRLTGVETNTPGNSNITYRKISDIDPTETRMVIGATEIILTPELAGTEAETLDGLCGIGKRTKAQRKEHKAAAKAKRTEKREVKKEKRQEKKEARGGSRVKKIALAPVRGAFSSLLLVNGRGLASRLSKAITVNEAEVKKMAAKLGYKYDKFKNQILKGAKKKPLLGSKIHGVVHQVDGIGVVVTAAAIAAAAPAILLAVQVLKKLGIGGEGSESDSSSLKEAATNLESGGGGTNVTVQSGGGGATPGEGGGAAPGEGGGESPGAEGGQAPGAGGGATPGAGGGSDEEPFYVKYKTPLLVVGAAGVLFLANKKYKFF